MSSEKVQIKNPQQALSQALAGDCLVAVNIAANLMHRYASKAVVITRQFTDLFRPGGKIPLHLIWSITVYRIPGRELLRRYH